MATQTTTGILVLDIWYIQAVYLKFWKSGRENYHLFGCLQTQEKSFPLLCQTFANNKK